MLYFTLCKKQLRNVTKTMQTCIYNWIVQLSTYSTSAWNPHYSISANFSDFIAVIVNAP